MSISDAQLAEWRKLTENPTEERPRLNRALPAALDLIAEVEGLGGEVEREKQMEVGDEHH